MKHLPNHLRAHRKRLGLSQKDIAYLLGSGCGAKVCRYERFTREPSLETALAYEAIFQRPFRELFSGPYQKIEKEVAARAKGLAERTKRQKPSRQNTRKCQTLKDMVSRLIKKPHKKS